MRDRVTTHKPLSCTVLVTSQELVCAIGSDKFLTTGIGERYRSKYL